MYAISNSTPGKFSFFSKYAAVAMLAAVTLLSGCGGGGGGDDVANAPGIPDSITITGLDGPSGVKAGTSTSFTVNVATTGGIDANEITYNWEQTSGTTIVTKSQSNANYSSTLTFTPLVANETVTFKVTANARGKTASQSKSVPVNP